jgi:hypothetical protein
MCTRCVLATAALLSYMLNADHVWYGCFGSWDTKHSGEVLSSRQVVAAPPS